MLDYDARTVRVPRMVKNVRLTRLTLVQSVDSVYGSARQRECVYLRGGERRTYHEQYAIFTAAN